MRKRKYKVGDKIVEFGQVFRIFKIESQKINNGETEKVIFFKPHMKLKETAASIICSIPVKNIDKSEIRKPMSKDEFRTLLKKFKKTEAEIFQDINKIKVALKSNDPKDTIRAIKALLLEKKKKSENFSKNKKDLLNSAVERLAQEFSVVYRVSLKKAKKKMHLTLQK
jgi:RNA polymerase-interacting CarD/CdnL/TRCF family regulator